MGRLVSGDWNSPDISGRPVRLGVLISGGGTTLRNFAECIREGTLSAEIPLVIAGRDCRGVALCGELGIPCEIIPRRDYPSAEAFSRVVFERLDDVSADLSVLAGFLSLIQIPETWQYRVLNIHPSLIPAFCGKGAYGHHVHEAAVQRGVKVSGCTVHFADNEYDHGPIILQRAVGVPDSATADDLAALVFSEEKKAYPEAVRRWASGCLQVRDGRTIYKSPSD